MKKLFDEKIYESEFFEIHQDWEIPIAGFFILAPKRKLHSIAEFNEGEQEDFGKILTTIRRAMTEVLTIQHVYFFENEDTTHDYHLWIFPRHPWMDCFGRKIQSVRPIMEYAKAEMTTESEKIKVIEAAQKMREYLNA